MKLIFTKKEAYLKLIFQIKKNSKIINRNHFPKKEKILLKVLIRITLIKIHLFLEAKRIRKTFLIHFRKKQQILLKVLKLFQRNKTN
jgi:hypothetical protein